MKVVGKMTASMARDEGLQMIGMCMRENIKMVSDPDMESINGQTESNTLDNGKVTKNMVRENGFSLTNQEERELSKMTRRTGSAFTLV